MEPSSLVVVANRLPVDRIEQPDGSVGWRRSPGGLVTALAPVMRTREGAWVGWSGAAGEAPEPFVDDGMELVPIGMTAHEMGDFYEGFSNATLWPLYHDVIVSPEYHREWWEAYVAINRRFADAAAAVAAEAATVWVHDYQLQLVPAMLRLARPDLRIGFFLHIPFPPKELFAQLPWRRQILEGLLGADLVGFQREGAATNFVALAGRMLGLPCEGEVVKTLDGRQVRAAAFPISIDAHALDERARRPETEAEAARMRYQLGNPRHVLLGVDRLDYTKGIGHRIKAFGELVAEGRLDATEAVFVQVATPSRERVDQYRILRDDLELQIGRLNGEHGALGHPPIHYLHTSYSRDDLVALFRAADVMVVTPLRDGMNLVAKEYVACRYDDGGVLLLSEFAGAADELDTAVLVNPHDVEGLKQAICDALDMPEEEQRRRMRAMREVVFDHDVRRWADDFLAELGVR